MLKRIVIAGLAFLALGAPAYADKDHGGFGASLFSNNAPGGLRDPANLTADSAAAVSSIEPAAGDSNASAATQGAGNNKTETPPAGDKKPAVKAAAKPASVKP